MVMLRRHDQTNVYIVDGIDPQRARFAVVVDPSKATREVWSFADTWVEYARYVFFPSDQADLFLQNGALTWRRLSRNPSIRIAWMSDPDLIDFRMILQSESPDLISLFGASIGNYAFILPANTEIKIHERGFRFDTSQLSANPVLRRGISDVPISGSTCSLDIVDTSGGAVSRFSFPLALVGRTATSLLPVPTDFDRLDIGIRFFSTRRDQETGRDFVVSPRFAVVQSYEVHQSVAATGFIDVWHREPASKGEEESSYIEFDDDCMPLGSHFRTAAGCEVVLSPIPFRGELPRLVFTRLRTDPPPVPLDGDHFYLAPKGNFRISAVRHLDGTQTFGSHHRLVCGKSGIEEVSFSIGDTIRFVPYREAFYASDNDLPSAPKLTDAGLTSWVRVIPADSTHLPSYRAQPDDAPLYSPDPIDVTAPRPQHMRGAGLSIFEFQEIPLVVMTDDPRFSIPVAPGDGYRPKVDSGSTPILDYVSLEAQYLEPERRRILLGNGGVYLANRQRAAGRLQDAVTPQGLLVKVDVDNSFRYDVLRLAKSQPQAKNDVGDPVEFQNVWASQFFTLGLQRNQLFAVISSVPAGVNFTRNELNILGWIFTLTLDPTLPDSERPLIILKYFDGKSVAELSEDRGSWAAGLFQDKDQQTLRMFIEGVRRKSQADAKHYAGILEKIESPNWSGVLAINIALNCKTLPDALKGIAIGIQRSEFRANHIGINASRYEPTGNGFSVEIKKSSIFGLIDYSPPTPQPAGGGGGAFEFTLTQLKVLFEQSAIRSFSARVRFGMKEPFKQRSSGADAVDINGTYQQKDGVDTYSFVYKAPQDPTEQDYIKLVNSDATPSNPLKAFIDRIKVRSIELVTQADSGSTFPKRVLARFSVNGTVDLGTLFQNYLCLNDVGFRDMFADFDFKITDQGYPIDFKRPTFQAGLLSFDLSKAQASSRSLLSYLPVTLNRFYFSASNSNPISLLDLGFLPLTPKVAGTNDVNAFDYALSFTLDLGCLGALAQPLKDFKAEILLGWFARGREAEASKVLGIRLPEGKLHVGIEGVLELVIKRFYLEICPPSSGRDAYYAIALHDCRIKVLGCGLPPSNESLDVFLFPNPASPLASRVGWFGGLEFGNATPKEFLGLGQRIAITPPTSAPVTCDVVINTLRGWARDLGRDPNEDGFRKISYAKDNQWTAAIDLNLFAGVRLKAVFNDPYLYALNIAVTPPGFSIDVVYRKISDDLGVYSTELRLPDALRHIEMGAASLTLPIIGLDIYTNGDFRVDLGFPWNVNFERCFGLQILPFIGKGGIYVGRLNGQTSTLLPVPGLKTVAVVGFGLSVGLGKEFEKGIFRFGISISLYGILEGALGYKEGNVKLLEPDAYCVLGRVGIIAQLFGTVDFGVCKVSVTIIIEVGLPFRIRNLGNGYEFSVPGIEANVSVSVEVVIGRAKVFGKKIEIVITMSFEMHLRLRFPIGEQAEANALRGGHTPVLLRNQATELRWDPSNFANLYEVLHA